MTKVTETDNRIRVTDYKDEYDKKFINENERATCDNILDVSKTSYGDVCVTCKTVSIYSDGTTESRVTNFVIPKEDAAKIGFKLIEWSNE